MNFTNKERDSYQDSYKLLLVLPDTCYLFNSVNRTTRRRKSGKLNPILGKTIKGNKVRTTMTGITPSQTRLISIKDFFPDNNTSALLQSKTPKHLT